MRVVGVEDIEIEVFAGALPRRAKSALASPLYFSHQCGNGAASLAENRIRFVFHHNAAAPFEAPDLGAQLEGFKRKHGSRWRLRPRRNPLDLMMTEHVRPRSKILCRTIERALLR